MANGIFRGWVRHRRYRPKAHEFRYPIFMLYLNLDDINALTQRHWFFSKGRFNVVSFHRDDYLCPEQGDLKHAVKHEVTRLGGSWPGGDVYMLSHVRYFGLCFNPITTYYVHNPEGELVYLLAEVTNTPWGERHRYLIRADHHKTHRSQCAKAHHVSPFMEMNMDYQWRFNDPDKRLLLHLENWQGDEQIFDATLTMKRQAFSGKNLRNTLLRYPAMTLQVVAGIYWQALKLWLKGVPFVAHPKTVQAQGETS